MNLNLKTAQIIFRMILNIMKFNIKKKLFKLNLLIKRTFKKIAKKLIKLNKNKNRINNKLKQI